MIIKNDDRQLSVREAMREGPGSVIQKIAVNKEDMFDKARLFATLILKKNCGIGYHEHINEEEIFIVNTGKGIYNDNGQEYEISAGDVVICKENEGHSITNYNDEELNITALILLK